jgi:hypothetical protein
MHVDLRGATLDAGQFDQIMQAMAGSATRRAAVGGMLGAAMGLLLRGDDSAAKQKGKSRRKHTKSRKRCPEGQVRQGKRCVAIGSQNPHDDGGCGAGCPSGQQCVNGRCERQDPCHGACASNQICLNGTCYSQDTCPAISATCPNFVRCGVDDSDCFCGLTTSGETICFQDEDFCETPRPCKTTSDCAGGRVCIASIACCEARDMPEVPFTCVLPCASPSPSPTPAAAAMAKRAQRSSGRGPGSA